MERFYLCFLLLIGSIVLVLSNSVCTSKSEKKLEVKKGTRIVLIGNNLASRMNEFGSFETELHLRYPDSQLFIRNMAHPGNTAGFRPHSSRNSPWAFPDADNFQDELANPTGSEGHFPSEDEWLTMLKPDIICAFFGYSESFDGEAGLANFKAELEAFIQHSTRQKYKDDGKTQFVFVSPIAFENLSDRYELPNGKEENENLKLYADAMKEIVEANNIQYVDVFSSTSKWFKSTKEFTIDGSQLSEEGYEEFSKLLADEIFGKDKRKVKKEHYQLVRDAVIEKNWMWLKDFKIPNGVHAYGRRFNPFGPDNYPAEVKKIREMTMLRDQAIWRASKGEGMDLAKADAETSSLPEVKTNYKLDENEKPTYSYGQDALDKFHVAPGYQIELFASEKEFPDLENPVQVAFDNEGRLWVAVMPTYPHWKPGDPKPNDKLIILEDTNGDGKADKQSTFADGLHLPIGFEIAPEGVYVSQSNSLILLKDTNGDGKADSKEVILSGFDDHDTHHAHSAYTGDPSGAIYMGEGTFLHSDIESSYGPIRASNGGFYRYSPQLRKLERVAQLAIPNPWGIAFDDWGQAIYSETSGPAVRWMLPGTVRSRYGEVAAPTADLIQDEHKVRPTSGLEFISSRHFPDDVQGDFLINNTIGFLGTKQHTFKDSGTGFKSRHRQDLIWSEDKSFRPVAMQFAPDGSLYLVDWHNVLIGHMQHNARDPLRDQVHGRIYRITYPSRPLVKPAIIAGASLNVLFDNLKLEEYRSRYRTRRELRGRTPSKVQAKLRRWVRELDQNDPRFEHHLLEALWVSWGINRVDKELLNTLLYAKDHRARAAAVHVLRYVGHQVDNQADLLLAAAKDKHGRVRLEAIVAASWLDKDKGLRVLDSGRSRPLDEWMMAAYNTSFAHLKGISVKEQKKKEIETDLVGIDRERFLKGSALFIKEGFCGTCHQADGKGLESSGFPPLSGTKWVTGSEERLIKLTLKGLHGPIKVLGKKYPGQVPMTPFEGMLNDEEMASVLTYVRNAFGNKAEAISPETVNQIREALKTQEGFYSSQDLLKEHPLEK